ncbi:MAG: hypothetical protein Q8R47_03685 [Nanoarchaeota archaeon]|nr:hypothetical protein [Nanoarchaeota archaeon]
MADLTEIISKEHLSTNDKEVLLREISLKYVEFVRDWVKMDRSMCDVNGGRYVMSYNPLTQKSMGKGKGTFIRLYQEWQQEHQGVSLPTFKFHRYLVSYLPEDLQDEVAIWETVTGPSG